jgi:hypothetical protein
MFPISRSALALLTLLCRQLWCRRSIGVYSLVTGVTLDTMKRILDGEEAYTPEMGSGGFQLQLSLAKHKKDLPFWKKYNQDVFLVGVLGIES